MRLAPLYEQDREQAVQEGIQQGKRRVIENVLRIRFGQLDEELSAAIVNIITLPPEEFTALVLQLSREELLARFGEQNNSASPTNNTKSGIQTRVIDRDGVREAVRMHLALR